jgi:hypothetical protein
MPSHKQKSFPALGALWGFVTFPTSLLSGFVMGLFTPVAVIAAMVALVRLLTGRVPYVRDISEEENGERQLIFQLMPVTEAKELFSQHAEQVGTQIGRMQADIQAIAQEAK